MPPAIQQSRTERVAEQRRALPDAPGVYLFKDERGAVVYVGKAKSIRKRVGSHFSKPGTRSAVEMTSSACCARCRQPQWTPLVVFCL